MKFRMNTFDPIKIEEYRSLRDEHLKNRSMVFERPLIILGLIAAVLSYFYDSEIGQFILALSILLICFNLWFIANRLQSDARIVGYIQLVLEPRSTAKWIGWENALRDYRQWMTTQRGKEQSETEPESKAPYDSFRFYPAIWGLHVVVFLLMLAGAIYKCYTSPAAHTYVGMGFSGLAATYFLYRAFGSLSPKRINPSIELECERWKKVLEMGQQETSEH